jgi:hypothetical protein
MTKFSGNATVTPNADAWIMVCLRCWADYNLLIYTHCQKLMNSVGSHGSLSLLFMMRVMVWCFVSNTHKVMTAFIVMSPSWCYSWVFSTVLYIKVYPQDLSDTDQVIATFWLRLLCVLELWLMISKKNCGCRQLWPTTWCWTITIECHLVTLEQSLMKERSVGSDPVK